MSTMGAGGGGNPAAGVFARGSGHEQVVFCSDAGSGLHAIVAIYSTALGPALGGTRCYPYRSEDEALTDVLHLSRAMAYKNALAGLDHGGGKAVLLADPSRDKTEALLRAYGRFVQSLGGRYVTACDVGTYVQDMDVVARECDHVTGRSQANGGAGDSSVLTALGVFAGMRACATYRWGSPSLTGRRVGVAGVGKVGAHLVGHLCDDGADVVVSDVNDVALARIRQRYPEIEVADDTDLLIKADLDVYAPCAMGGVLNSATVPALSASIVCGGANNQLAEPGVSAAMAERGILYAPDYCVNAGGVIQVADERRGFDFERARMKTEQIFDTTLRVLTAADRDGIPPAAAADRLAEQRMEQVGRLSRIWVER